MRFEVAKTDRFGLARPAVDAHTLGISSTGQLLMDCGFSVVVADVETCGAFNMPDAPRNLYLIENWVRHEGITVLGLSYRLDPAAGSSLLGRTVHSLKAAQLLAEQGGPLRGLFFAGLPRTCELVRQRIPEVSGVFCGDETPAETLAILGINPSALSTWLGQGLRYDEDRLAFGKDLVRRGKHLSVRPVDRSGYPDFGTPQDSLIARLRHAARYDQPALMRAHVGPYLPDRKAAVGLFLQWCRQLAAAGHLDVLSIGTSQLTQSSFGSDWGTQPNGGGVPLNSPEEFAAVWDAARPMLVRTYAGTHNIAELARMYEHTIHTAWHALSFWWFCQIDGRGPLGVRENLHEHFETMRFIAESGKPLEPNVSHHFSFRGGDDVTYIVSAVLAAKAAKSVGIRHLIFQNMLNTPKTTWGVQDLAKARAALMLLRTLEDETFSIIHQPRGGLDYFSHDQAKARAQLAAITALMADIEPHDVTSPPIIHVVSYSEGAHLADPSVVNESVQITRFALAEYRRLRHRGEVEDMTRNPDVQQRTAELITESREVISAIESKIPEPYSADGLYRVLAEGFLPVPNLWACRDEFPQAVRWPTRLVLGSIKCVDEGGMPIPVAKRLQTL